MHWKTKSNALLTWTPEALEAFELLKQDLCIGLMLVSPQNSKSFYLYVSKKKNNNNKQYNTQWQ